MIMQIAERIQLARPGVEAVQSRASLHSGGVAGRQRAITFQRVEITRQPGAVIGPDRGPHLQPAFPVSAPADLLDELFRALKPVGLYRGAGQLVLADHPPAYMGAKARDIGPVIRPRSSLRCAPYTRPMDGVNAASRASPAARVGPGRAALRAPENRSVWLMGAAFSAPRRQPSPAASRWASRWARRVVLTSTLSTSLRASAARTPAAGCTRPRPPVAGRRLRASA